MPANFGEVTLSRAELEEALKVLDSGCSGQLTIVFSDATIVGIERVASEGFEIAPRSIHCMYGCKKDADIANAMLSRKGIVRDSC